MRNQWDTIAEIPTIEKLFCYRTDGTIEYDLDAIMDDKTLLKITGMPLKQKWAYLGNEILKDNNVIIQIIKVDTATLIFETDSIATFFKIAKFSAKN